MCVCVCVCVCVTSLGENVQLQPPAGAAPEEEKQENKEEVRALTALIRARVLPRRLALKHSVS